MPIDAHPTLNHLAALALALLPCACLDGQECGLYDECSEPESAAETEGQDPGEVETCEGPERLTLTDSTDAGSWVYFDLDSCAEVGPGEGWELGFQRFQIILNGGVSGEGSVDGTYVDGVDLSELSATPDEPSWRTDEPDADADGEDELLFIDWYDYEIATHVLTAKTRVYLVRSTKGQTFALQLDDYYSSAGSSGHVRWRWKPLG